jgi:hypothetical protein
MRQIITIALATGFVGAASLVAPPAVAEQPSSVPETVKTACEADYKALCATVFPGEGRVLACLRKSWDEVSGPCRDAIEKFLPKR